MSRPLHLRLTATLAGILAVAACTSSDGGAGAAGSDTPDTTPAARAVAPVSSLVLDARDGAALSIQASAAVWQTSPVAVTVSDPASIEPAAIEAVDLGVPVLMLPDPASPAAASPASASPATARPEAVADPASASPDASAADPLAPVAAELSRLGATTVLHIGPDPPDLPGVEVVGSVGDLPEFEATSPVENVASLVEADSSSRDDQAAALATLQAAGASAIEVGDPDPRVRPADIEALAEADPAVAIGVGADFGSDDEFGQRVAVASTGVQLPGGGQTVFDDKRYVALYGHPLTGALGVLGEQGPESSVARARKVAAPYADLTDDTIVPAFEIIATVAAGAPGKDGNYSNEWDVEVLRPLVDAAAEAGIYVVLDLQSGKSDFLSQARDYEELLLEPHVGLALDPEWRLYGTQKPLVQIGSVSAAEINETLDWLAGLTAEADLPQKMVLLHQFRTDMITDRADLDLSHDELAVIVQMDGDGTMGQKLDTWAALRANAPKALRFGWKNFYDEDEPTPNARTTFGVDPRPWWVSYQ